ncbi:2-Cys peroxiredoxin BAS1, chloroplastic [Chlamydiales bacterium SCGC AB-751-O23]|jgi:peroxiredoxin 2/4|nr:2-Cys peroxiredoxin BAS1, chloroplastic [Chlamydiales bacterium SCGC AB-751-O23]
MTNLIGQPAPEFIAGAVVNGKFVNNFSLSSYVGKSKVIFFFYPLDFTFVCPTELHAFEEMKEEFEKRNTVVVACSVDSCYSHKSWLETPKSKGGIEGITYPIVADMTKQISQKFDVLKEDEGIAYRGLFLIDEQGIVRHQMINDLPLGRSVDEALRIVDALTFVEKHGEVCPANWATGKKAMKPNTEGLKAFFS